ncbi:MAG TPA: class I SAM-dependent methyltransferase [Verrucomicrobiae bacterium]|nr:class I SAM-dependent methyltransferase [Verrucomicrobiae bacterium]
MASIHSSPGGTKFGEDPDRYDFARPPYPAALFDWVRTRAKLGPKSVCFEIGAGTGHASLPILDTPVLHLRAIEPDARLAEKLRRKAIGQDVANLATIVSRFEDDTLADDGYDFGFAAMSMHWLPRMKALTKARHALKPSRHFAMWWKVYHNSAAPDAFGQTTAHLFSGVEQDPNATDGRPAFALDVAARLGELRNAGFKDAEHALFEQQVTFSPESLSALYGTFSRVRMAPEETRDRLLSEAERIVRDQFGGSVTRTVSCSAFIGRKP